MERRGPKVRKTEYIVEEEHEEETPVPDSGSDNAKRKTPHRKDDTAVNVEDPLNNPQLEGDQVRREQRKRHAPAPDVAPPKKPAQPLVTEPATAETDQSSAEDVLMLAVENLTIDQSGRKYKEGAVPRPQPEVLVSQEPSGYAIAQASFLDTSSESVSSGSGKNVPGRSSEGVPSSSGTDEVGSVAEASGSSVAEASGSSVAEASGSSVAEASGSSVAEASGSSVAEASGSSVAEASGSSVAEVSGESRRGEPILEIADNLPIITIDAAEERYANIITRYNYMISTIRRRFTSYRNICEGIPELVMNTRHEYWVLPSGPDSTLERKSAFSMASYNLVNIGENLLEDIIKLKERLNECTKIANKIMQIYSADNTLPNPIPLTEDVCLHLNLLDKWLELMSRVLRKCEIEASRYNNTLDLNIEGIERF